MEIILLERIERLGQMGDVVTVKDGYARNFLLPEKKALRATVANQKVFDSQRKEIEARNLTARTEAEGVAKTMDGQTVVLLRQAGETGQLYGSVASRDISAALREVGFKIRRSQIILDHPIKEIGVHEVTVRLHPEVSITVKINTARSTEEAELQVAAPEAVAEVFETEELAQAAETALSDAPEEEEESAKETDSADSPEAEAENPEAVKEEKSD